MKNYKNIELFIAVYSIHLNDSVLRYPDEYAYPISEVPLVISRMRAAIENKGIGAVNIDSRTFKAATKKLGIRNTYKAIETFLNGDV